MGVTLQSFELSEQSWCVFSFGLCFKVSNCLPLDGIKGKALSHHIWTVKQIHKLGFKIYRLAI